MKRVLIVLIALMVCLIVLTGCNKDKNPLMKNKKKELVQMIEDLSNEILDKDARIEELETILRGVHEEDAPTAAITTIDDGTGRLTFNSIDGKIVFPQPFEYPGSTQAPNTASVNITELISIVPTNNWTMCMDGTTLELEHTSGISGIVKASAIDELYSREGLQDEVMSPFFEDFPPSNIKYSRLFLDGDWWGLEAQAPTTIDEKPAFIRCGMLGLGEQSFTYIFLYQGEQDKTKDETIVSLLRSMKMLGMQLRIE